MSELKKLKQMNKYVLENSSARGESNFSYILHTNKYDIMKKKLGEIDEKELYNFISKNEGNEFALELFEKYKLSKKKI